MDSYFFLFAGISIVLITAYDLIYTTFSPRGAGFISDFVTSVIWNTLRLFYKITGNHKIMRGAGIIIVCATLLSWLLLLWGGHFMIVLADQDAVLDSTTNLPATSMQRLYYSGYILSTMGNGDYKGGSDGWRVYSAVISFAGLTLITIAISYMVPVISAVTERRALSIRIRSIGETSQRVILDNWNGNDCKRLEDQFNGLAESVALQAQMHLSYPVLQYFHHGQKATALLPSLAMLDEALTIMLLYLPENTRPDPQHLIPLRKAVTNFLQTLDIVSNRAAETEVPSLDVDLLLARGLPLKQLDPSLLSNLDYRRKMLRSMVEHDGWKWNEEADSPFDSKMDLPSVS
ncbi:ion channel [Pontibacter cellulosilyticus]|uniref:Two pore domain potassium channel family protein n=1 Tax=Pontibacter cellulosilyticus TaxID=1720253 RepID=A0A923SII0_9BACT|nr:ion channel [Pontibacter cellulosilyticus]MBC5991691.1 two pore domain potassium channel family protein [Pontibacter cellulosilyticus]